MPSRKDFEIDIKVHMSSKLFIGITMFTWMWVIFSFFYTLYVARTGHDPILDYTVGLPSTIMENLGWSGVWGLAFFGIATTVILSVMSYIITRKKR